MKDLNEWLGTGRLTRDPEIKITANGKTKALFTLAVNRGATDSGAAKPAYFIACQAWGKTAEIAQKYLRKGRRVFVRGPVFQRSGVDDDGKNRRYFGVDVRAVNFLDAPPDDVKAMIEGDGADPDAPPFEEGVTDGS